MRRCSGRPSHPSHGLPVLGSASVFFGECLRLLLQTLFAWLRPRAAEATQTTKPVTGWLGSERLSFGGTPHGSGPSGTNHLG